MDPEIKAKWIAALRSGKYPQTSMMLRGRGGFCCLGVLCDVVMPTGWHESTHQTEWTHIGNFSTVDDEIKEEIDLTEASEAVLMDMNDAGKSFAEIALYIEKNL